MTTVKFSKILGDLECSEAYLSERKWDGGQGTLEALLGSAPRLRELRLEESPAGPLPLIR